MHEKRYFIGLGLAVCVLLINQVFIQYQLSTITNDAYIINIAGKQRMLSQKINLAFYKIVDSSNRNQQEAISLYQEWEAAHQKIIYSDLGRDYLKKFSTKNTFVSLEKKINYIHTFLSPDYTLIKKKLDHINQNQASFLVEMDELVGDIENISSKKVTQLRMIEIALFIISILIVLLELLFIFKPIERKLLATIDDLKSSNKTLVLKNEQLEEFTYITSHDLREPLQTISAITHHLKEAKEIDDVTQKRMMTYLSDSSKRMSDLITGVMRHLQIGKTREKVLCDCNKIVAEVCQDLDDLIQKNNATINTKKLPIFFGEKVEIRQLFQNLISNAVKYRKKNVAPEITIDSKIQENAYLISVEDNGIGMDLEHKEKIFKMFQRLHNQDEYEGTGVGLANCKKIVEYHGGNIWVDSTEGIGSIFYFTIRKDGKA